MALEKNVLTPKSSYAIWDQDVGFGEIQKTVFSQEGRLLKVGICENEIWGDNWKISEQLTGFFVG